MVKNTRIFFQQSPGRFFYDLIYIKRIWGFDTTFSSTNTTVTGALKYRLKSQKIARQKREI